VTVRGVSFKTVALTVLIALACPCTVGQAEPAPAATTLARALEFYNALDFHASKNLLTTVDRDQLSSEDRQTFDNYFAWIDTAIQEQVTAQQWLAYGEGMLARGNLQEAELAFEQAASSEFLDLDSRRLAAARLAAVRESGQQPDPTTTEADRALSERAAAEAFAGEIGFPDMVVVDEVVVDELALADGHQPQDTPALNRPVFDEIVLAEATVEPDEAGAHADQWVQPMDESPADPDGHQDDTHNERHDVLLAAGIAAMDHGYDEQAEGLFRQALMEDPRSTQAEQLLRQVQAHMAGQDADLQAFGDADGVSDIAALAQADALLEEASSELGGEDSADSSDDAPADDAAVVDHDIVADDTAEVDTLADDAMLDDLIDSGDDALYEDDNGSLPRAIRIRRIRREQAEVEFEKAMNAAAEALAFANVHAQSEADFEDAKVHVRLAQDVLETRKSLFTDAEYRDLLVETRNELTRIKDDLRVWQEARNEAIKVQERIAEEERIEQQKAQKREKLETLTERADTLLGETRYEQALEVLEQIIELEPTHPYAVERLELLQDFVILQKERQYTRTMYQETAVSRLDNLEAMIPWHQIIRYPDYWPELSNRRLREGAEFDQSRESEANRRVYQQLQAKQTFELDGITLEDVLQYISNVAGVNIHVKWGTLNAAGVDRNSEVNIRLIDVPVEKALRVILEDVAGVNPLDFYVDEGVITISTQSDLAQNMQTRVYDIRDLLIHVPDFEASQLDLAAKTEEAQLPERAEEEEIDREEIINDLIDRIMEIVDERSWDEGSITEYRGQLIVKQTKENHLKILELLKMLREARAIQISIEARFITVDASFLERVGIDLDVFFNIGSPYASREVVEPPAGVLGPPNAIDAAGDPIYVRSTHSVLLPQVADTQAHPLDPWMGGVGGGALQGNISRFPGDHTAQSSHWTPIGVRSGNKLTWAASKVATDLASAPTALSIAGAFMDDIEVDFLVEATQACKTSRVLTAPRLTLFNGQRAYITVGEQLPYLQSVRIRVAQQIAAYEPIIGIARTGVSLDVQATVSADRRYVTLTVRPQVAELLNWETAQFVGGTLRMPQMGVKDLKTTVSIPDGGTLLLGGLRTVTSQDVEIGPPILSKVPVVNRFFTTRSEGRDETTLLILMKPKIIIQREEEEDAFP